MEFQVNDQVMVKRKIRSGNLIRMGHIVRLDGDKAQVYFPIDYCQAVVPTSQLQKTSSRFGNYKQVQASSVRRAIYPVRGKV